MPKSLIKQCTCKRLSTPCYKIEEASLGETQEEDALKGPSKGEVMVEVEVEGLIGATEVAGAPGATVIDCQ